MPQPHLLLALTLSLCLAPLPAHTAPLGARDLLAVKWPSQLDLSPDGKRAVFVVSQADVAGNRRQKDLFLALLAGGPRTLRRLTNARGSNTSPAFSPDGKQIAFVSSRGGDAPQIWLIPVDGGEAVQLTSIATGATGPHWSPDGKHLAFVSSVFPDCRDEACNRQRLEAEKKRQATGRIYDGLLIRHWNEWRDERRAHILVVDVTNGKADPPRDLTPGPADAPSIALGGDPDYAFSPDGKTLAYVSNTERVVATSTNNDVFEVPVAGGKPVRISVGQGNDYSPRYSRDGKHLAWLSMERPGYESDRARLLVRERRSGRIAEWTRGFADHPLAIHWAPNSQEIYFNASHQGQQEIFLARPAGVTPLTRGRYVRELRVSPDGRTLLLVDEATHRPPELFSLSAGLHVKAGRELRPLTALNTWLPRRTGLLPAEPVWFAGEGGERVHGVLVKPPGFQRGRRYPAVVIVHGGPQGMSGDDFHPRWNLQMFAAAGYVVFAINFHGSVGFGQPFTDAITGDWGGRPYRDVMRGVEHLARLPFVRPDRIAAAGASYGGYLVNWIATQTRRFSCLISHAGVYNLESKYGSTEELWFPEWEMRGTPWSNRPLYRRWSPHSQAEKIRTPTLVIHGQRDYRVPVEQGLQLYTALQRQSVPSRLLYFPDEDHFVQRPHNVILWWATMHDWLARYLKR